VELYVSSPLCLSAVGIINFAVGIYQEILRLVGDMKRVCLRSDVFWDEAFVLGWAAYTRSTSVAFKRHKRRGRTRITDVTRRF